MSCKSLCQIVNKLALKPISYLELRGIHPINIIRENFLPPVE